MQGAVEAERVFTRAIISSEPLYAPGAWTTF